FEGAVFVDPSNRVQRPSFATARQQLRSVALGRDGAAVNVCNCLRGGPFEYILGGAAVVQVPRFGHLWVSSEWNDNRVTSSDTRSRRSRGPGRPGNRVRSVRRRGPGQNSTGRASRPGFPWGGSGAA